MATEPCVLDTSAIVEVALKQDLAEQVVSAIQRSSQKAVGAPSLVEAVLVLQQRMGYDPRAWLDAFLRNARIEVIAFGFQHYHLATEAFLLYGKGRHPAALNFGDCLAYAGAVERGWPLLYIGNDFTKTDVRAALPPPLRA